jgi:hypothetical protein
MDHNDERAEQPNPKSAGAREAYLKAAATDPRVKIVAPSGKGFIIPGGRASGEIDPADGARQGPKSHCR